jgi:hypothetical protein
MPIRTIALLIPTAKICIKLSPSWIEQFYKLEQSGKKIVRNFHLFML